MKANLGLDDKLLRGIIGVLMLIAAYFRGVIYTVMGLVLMATAGFNWCPVYAIIGITTIDEKEIEVK